MVFKDISFAAQQLHRLASGGIQINTTFGADVPGMASAKRLATQLASGSVPENLGQHAASVIANVGALSRFGAEYLWFGNEPIDHLDITLHLDPTPNPDSRVTLGDSVDALGLRKVNLDWRFNDIDRHTFKWMVDAIAGVASDLGRIKLDIDWSEFDDVVFWHFHNLCTTRMAENAREGVVDASCKVHGIDNLFVAGSSVFSTSGAGSPTLTIITLAIRLADHLKATLRS